MLFPLFLSLFSTLYSVVVPALDKCVYDNKQTYLQNISQDSTRREMLENGYIPPYNFIEKQWQVVTTHHGGDEDCFFCYGVEPTPEERREALSNIVSMFLWWQYMYTTSHLFCPVAFRFVEPPAKTYPALSLLVQV